MQDFCWNRRRIRFPGPWVRKKAPRRFPDEGPYAESCDSTFPTTPTRGRKKKGGVWELATLSFPGRLTLGARCHPSSAIGCQFPDAAPASEERFACLSGSAAEPADGVATTGLSGETSWPDPRTPAGAPVSGPQVGVSAENGLPFRLACPRTAPLPRMACGRWPRTTGLVSYPSRCIPFLRRTIPFPAPPADSDLIAPPAVIALPGAFRRAASVRDGRLPFHPSRLRHRGDCAASFAFVLRPRDPFPPHWLTVATIGLGPTVSAGSLLNPEDAA